jgi:cytochrome c oxidase subunit 1
MDYVAIADRDVHLHDPDTFITKYIWSQDHKVIAIQYSLIAIGVGLLALVLSGMMRLQLGFPNTFTFITPSNYLQFITMHGMIMVIYLLTALFLGGFGNYLIPLMCGSRDMVFPYMNMLSVWVYLLAVIILLASFFVPGGPTGAGWTLYPPQAILPGTSGATWGIILMLVSLAVFIVAFTMGGLNYVTTVLQARCKGMTMMRMPLSVWGIFMATILGLLAFPALLVSAIMMILDSLLGTSFFHAGAGVHGQTDRPRRRQSGALPAPVLVLRASRGVHRRAACVRHRVRSPERSCPQEHLRLSHDGVGHPGDRHSQLRGLGAPHVRKRHESLLRILLRHHHAHHRDSHGDQGLQLGAHAVARQHHLRVPMLFAIGFIFTFIHGGLTGLFLGNVTVDLPLSDTYFVVAHFHMVMGVSPILVVFGAIYHWYPKITGRMFNETLARSTSG